MRAPFVHEATVGMAADGDTRGPGGAITLELCGSWDHSPPCPVAAHHTRAERAGGTVVLRVVFATEPEDEADVRRRIDQALHSGRVTSLDGVVSHWEFHGSRIGVPTPAEAEHARRLART
ncbi:hypothetical protein AB0N24_11620 [Arthrobacter sp. NPDC093128]|uniref:hypothetical protein n=1 Tax=Arthrobacter sp. NPDC093128 TaxID=3154979 RepID=UPI003421D0D6